MIDTGTEVNIIKEGAVESNLKTDDNDIINVCGITGDHIRTKGSLAVHLFGKEVRFYVVASNFPIEQDGILGSEFLKSVGADVSYTQ